MHPKSISAIKNHLNDFLRSATSTEAVPLNASVIKAASEIYKTKKDYMSQVEIQLVIGDFVENTVSKKGNTQSGKGILNSSEASDGISLQTLLNTTESNDLIDQIVDYFNSLPRQYTCVFKIPNVVSTRQLSEQVNEKVTLEFIDQKDSGALFKTLLGEGYSEYSLSITVKHSGYLSNFDYGEPYGIFKHLVGIAVALGYFKSNVLRSALLSRGLFGRGSVGLNANSYFIDDAFGAQSKVTMHFSDSVNEKLYDLEFNSEVVEGKIEEIIKKIKYIYTSFKNDEIHANRIRSALEWSYDSKFTNNATFTFILNCIAIEALMGDSSTSIGKTLANRCAYMLAKSSKERKFLADEIEKLYFLRSKLVHGNQARPDKEDSLTMHFADTLLKRLLKNELSVILSVSD